MRQLSSPSLAIPDPQSEIRNAAPARARQKKTLTFLAAVLILAGLVVLLLLQRIPLPLRLAIGFVDVVAGLTLLVLVRQKFR